MDLLEKLYHYVVAEIDRARQWREDAQTHALKSLFEGVRLGNWNLLQYIKTLRPLIGIPDDETDDTQESVSEEGVK